MYQETSVVCSCGNEFKVNSNKKELHLEVCNQCHPFYTGKQGGASKAGNIDKFNKKHGLEEKAA